MRSANAPVAMITGASSGIGKAVAQRLANEGYRLCLTARRTKRLDSLSQVLGKQTEVLVESADMRDEQEILAVFKSIEAHFGALNVLVNSAGLGHDAPLTSGESEDWREMLDVNVLGLSIATREAVKLMRRTQDNGHIIHISSMSGHRVPGGTGSMYSATKFAVRALTEGLRKELYELKSNIRICAISPGFVETEFAAVMSGSEKRAQETYNRFQCLTADDVADSVSWVLRTPLHMQVHDILMRPTAQPT